jgi:2,4-dienoyl-CoA reductase-like NADH-dependent reductase (Old Yellow Enzyme family)
MGRVVHPSVSGVQPVSASATTAPGDAHTYQGKAPHVLARPLRLDEIPRLLDEYRLAAINAIAAGFDGVQLHAANGYLIDQFLRDSSNHRTDAYGGPIENRIRLLGEVTQALIETVGAGRTSVRLSPNGDTQGVNDSEPHLLFPAAAKLLSDLGIAFLELREPPEGGTFGTPDVAPVAPAIRKAFARPLVLNSDYDEARAQAALTAGIADAIAFGRPFMANPDLPHRLAEAIPLATTEMATAFSQGPQGYTDYPPAGARTVDPA